MNRICFILLVLFPLFASAQWQRPLEPVSNVSIFSEDGKPFYLFLNGMQYNREPQSYIRIEGLPEPYYNCMIQFADRRIPSINRRFLMLADIEGEMLDITYKIIRTRRGDYQLRYHSELPMRPNNPWPERCAVYHFGAPNTRLDLRRQPGIPDRQGPRDFDEPNPRNPRFVPRPNDRPNANVLCNTAMRASDFQDALRTINNSSFDDTKLSTAKQIISINCMSVQQISQVMKQFSFEQNKLDFAKFAFDYCLDQERYFNLANELKFDASKTELSTFLAGRTQF